MDDYDSDTTIFNGSDTETDVTYESSVQLSDNATHSLASASTSTSDYTTDTETQQTPQSVSPAETLVYDEETSNDSSTWTEYNNLNNDVQNLLDRIYVNVNSIRVRNDDSSSEIINLGNEVDIIDDLIAVDTETSNDASIVDVVEIVPESINEEVAEINVPQVVEVMTVAQASDLTVEVTSSERSQNNKRECEKYEDGDTEAPNKKHKLDDSMEGDDGSMCPVCMDAWSNTGEHRVCCLKCGHLFGHSCLKRWMETQPPSKRTCPTCKRKATNKDIRFLYVKRLLAVDVSELDGMRRKLEDCESERLRLKMELDSSRLKSEQKINRLEQEVCQLRLCQLVNVANSVANIVDEVKPVSLKMFMDKSMEISREGGCRVLAYNKVTETICVSMNYGRNPLYAGQGFGIRKISVPEYRNTAFIALHHKPIRDVSYRPNHLEVLTVSLDGSCRLVDMLQNRSVSTFHCDGAIWSCSWDAMNSELFYAGEARGGVVIFDLRNPREPYKRLEIPNDASPVVSLASMRTSSILHRGRILCCKLNSCWSFESDNDYSTVQLPIDGPFMSLSYSNNTNQVLISSRPNQRFPYTRHTLSQLSNQPDSFIKFDPVHTFQGAQTQKMLGRSCLFNHQSSPYVAAYHEQGKNVTIWNADSKSRTTTMPAHQPVLDICHIPCDRGSLVATLNEKKLDFFKIISDS